VTQGVYSQPCWVAMSRKLSKILSAFKRPSLGERTDDVAYWLQCARCNGMAVFSEVRGAGELREPTDEMVVKEEVIEDPSSGMPRSL